MLPDLWWNSIIPTFPLFSCLMALIVSTRVWNSSRSVLSGSCVIRQSTESWTVWLGLKRVWKCSNNWFRMDAFSVSSFWPFDLSEGLWTWCIFCLQDIMEPSVVTNISTVLRFLKQVCPPLILNLSFQWRVLPTWLKTSFLSGQDNWARCTWWAALFFARKSWIS